MSILDEEYNLWRTNLESQQNFNVLSYQLIKLYLLHFGEKYNFTVFFFQKIRLQLDIFWIVELAFLGFLKNKPSILQLYIML